MFYFTGHGDFLDDDFYYLLPDFSESRRRQTSLQNSEIDNLLRSLSPKMAIKIVDACHSGISFIKDPDAISKYLKGTMGQFNKCYFMYSSQLSQSSYQDTSLSYFTKALGNSIYQHDAEIVRYKDTIDYISDFFISSKLQTPLFVTQADFTEYFCTVSPSLKNDLSQFFQVPVTPIQGSEASQEDKLLALVKEDSKKYVGQDEAIANMEKIPNIIEKHHFEERVLSLFSITITTKEHFKEIPNTAAIGQFVEKHLNEYFAKPTYKTVTRMVDDYSGISSLISMNYLAGRGPQIQKEVTEVSGIQATIPLPFSYISIHLKPKYPNINSVICFILPILSQTNIRFFWTFANCKQAGWDEESIIDSNIKWTTTEIGIRDMKEIETQLHNLLSDFSTFTVTWLQEKFKPVDESSKSAKK